MGGRNGYKRDHFIYGTAPGKATTIDDEMRVVIREHPDPGGNVNSPMASVFDLGSFVSALTELALQAETTNSRPRLWTQMKAPKAANGIDPQSLFFDSTSRDVQSSQGVEDNQSQLHALALQAQMTKLINQMQTGPQAPGGYDIQSSSFSSGGGSSSKSHVPPEVQPSLFVLPKVRRYDAFVL